LASISLAIENGALLVGQGREQLDQLAKKDAIKGKKKEEE